MKFLGIAKSHMSLGTVQGAVMLAGVGGGISWARVSTPPRHTICQHI